MKKTEIKVGTRYRTMEYGNKRCAEVISDPVPHPYKTRKYEWEVIYPFALGKDDQPVKGKLEAEYFTHEWNSDDQKAWDKFFQDQGDSEAAEHLLESLGFEESSVSIHSGGERASISLRGKESVDKLIEYLSMAHNMVKENAR